MQASQPRAIAPKLPTWRLVAAGFLHFGLIGYLISVVPLSLLLAPSGAGATEVLRTGLRLSGIFLVAFLLLGMACVMLAALWDGRKRGHGRRSSTNAPAIARDRVTGAVETARRALDSAAQPLLLSIATRGWAYDDDRYQALARDLDLIVGATVTALGEAPPEAIPAIRAQATSSLGIIDQALADLDGARASAAADAAQTAALYIQNRYGSSDFTIKAD